MGAATRHRRAFLSNHPYCAFCGGKALATNVEHCPPRSLFQDRQWPEGFEFPCCEECNHSTSNDDLLIAMLARFDPFTELGDRDGKQNGLMQGVIQQFPGLFPKMIASTTREARRPHRNCLVPPARLLGIKTLAAGRVLARLDDTELGPEISQRNLPTVRKLLRLG